MIEPVHKKATIIGLGLVGGSIAAALKAQGTYVSAFDTNSQSTASGLEMGIVDEAATTIESAIKDADLIVVAVPVLSMAGVFSSISGCFHQEGITITDVGSVKSEVVQAIKRVNGVVPDNFVPGHPIAGSEKPGVLGSDAGLFENHKVILTPLEETSRHALDRVHKMWVSFGARVMEMHINHHDQILAQTSHLPHLLAYALIDTLSAQGDSLEIFDYAAGGLRDFSRIAASDPTMWRDIFQSNRGPLISILDAYMADLAELRFLIEQDQMDEVYDLLERAKKARDHFSQILENRTK